MPTERSGGALVFRVDCHRKVAGNGWDEPCKSRGLRTVLWAAGGEIPPADPAVVGPGAGLLVDACHDLRSLPPTTSSHGRRRLPARACQGIPDLATGDLRPSGGIKLTATHRRVDWCSSARAAARLLEHVHAPLTGFC
jgi:hypothetical protein